MIESRSTPYPTIGDSPRGRSPSHGLTTPATFTGVEVKSSQVETEKVTTKTTRTNRLRADVHGENVNEMIDTVYSHSSTRRKSPSPSGQIAKLPRKAAYSPSRTERLHGEHDPDPNSGPQGQALSLLVPAKRECQNTSESLCHHQLHQGTSPGHLNLPQGRFHPRGK